MLPGRASAQSAVTVSAVLNGASYALPGLPNSGIAQGSIFIVFGQNLGPAAIVQVNKFPLPTVPPGLAGTSIKVTVAGTTVDAIMLYTLATQVAAVLPSSTPLGTGTLTLTYNGQTSDPAPITVVKSSFGMFTLNQAGSGAAVLQNVNSATDRPINGSTKAAHPGQVMILWGTGIGPVAGDEAAGPLPGDMKSLDLHVWVGGVQATVQYRGRSGCCTGIDQIVFVVPAGVDGCVVPVYVQIGNIISNFGSMSIAKSGSVCADANGLSASLIQQATQNGGLRTGSVYVGRNNGEAGNVHSQSDAMGAGFNKVTLDAILNGIPIPQAGRCAVIQFPGHTPPGISPLDAGKVSVTTPIGPYDLFAFSKGVNVLSFVPGTPNSPGLIGDGTQLKGGTYTFTVAGGADVRGFTESIEFPRTFEWDHDAITAVNRSQPLTITWTGGTAGALVTIQGTSTAALTAKGAIGASFFCWADATQGSFTVPVSILSALPPSLTDNKGRAQGTLTVFETLYGNPFTASGSLDYGTIFFSDSYSKGFMPFN